MRTDVPFLLATTVGVGSIIGGELAPMLQAHPLAHDLWVGFWLLFLIAIWTYHYRAPLLARFGWAPSGSRVYAPIALPKAEWMALADAARYVIDGMPQSRYILSGRQLFPEREAFLEYVADLVARNVPVYGKRPLSKTMERIPQRDLQSAVVQNGATELAFLHEQRHPVYLELSVKPSELEAKWQAIKAATE